MTNVKMHMLKVCVRVCVFSVQKQTIPALLSGRDAVVRSQTGSGETLQSTEISLWEPQFLICPAEL